MAVAFALTLPIGWDREARAGSAGLRTFPLVAVASCGFMLTGMYVLEGDGAMARIMFGVVTGIGFIGGGAILKDKGNVQGTATAASIWNTGAIGVAVAWHRFEIAIVLALLNFLTLRFTRKLKDRIDEKRPDSDDSRG
ncbi:MgtC/SapB family protein [candidate division GN15 bacterium]|nr:MgtC/SapB family protein [candidate division GN15 bacterium]